MNLQVRVSLHLTCKNASGDVRDPKVLKATVFRQLKSTAYYQALPDAHKEPAYWVRILQRCGCHRDLPRGTVLGDDRSPGTPMDRLPSHLHTSPSDILHPTGGRKPWGRLFIVLTGGVQVQKFDGDDGSLLDSGESFGLGCDVKELENPRRAVVFCDKTSVLEISSELMQFSLELQKSDYVRFLKSTRLFSKMPMQDGFVEELIPLLQIKRFSSNDVIVRQGEGPSDLFILLSGSVRVVQEVVVPYQMAKHGYTRTPGETMLPVSEAAVKTLAHAKQGRFAVKKRAEKTASSARTMFSKTTGHATQNESEYQQKLTQEATKEILSSNGIFVSTMSRVAPKKPRSPPKSPHSGVKSPLQARQRDPVVAANSHRSKEKHGHTSDADMRSLVVELRHLWRGAYFGELSIVNKVPKSASVIAMTPVQVMVLSKIEFYRHFDEDKILHLKSQIAENEYALDENTVGTCLRWDTTWTEYSQNTTTDALFKNSVESHDTKVQSRRITDTLLADPATISSMMTREEEPRLSWLEIRRIRDDELPDRTTKRSGSSQPLPPTT